MSRPTLVGAVALALAATGVALAAAWHRADRDATTTTTATAAQVERTLRLLPCPALGHRPIRASAPPTGSVPLDAVAARLCPVLGRGDASWSAPRDALTTGVASLAAQFGSLPLAVPDETCLPPQKPVDWTITFEYPSGRLVRVESPGPAGGRCPEVSIAGVPGPGRNDASALLTGYLRLLRMQRADSVAPTQAGVLFPTCAHARSFRPGLLPSAAALNLVRARVCERFGFGGGVLTGVLTPPEVARVNAGNATEATTRPPSGLLCTNPVAQDVEILGVTAWGDRVVLRSSGCPVFVRGLAQSQPEIYWKPTGQAWRMLDAVLRARR